MQNLPPLPNEAFDGEKQSFKIEHNPHKHFFVYKNSDVICKNCPVGWPNLARAVMIVNGEIVDYSA